MIACVCGPAAGSCNPYPSPQRDAWFASHLCSHCCSALDWKFQSFYSLLLSLSHSTEFVRKCEPFTSGTKKSDAFFSLLLQDWGGLLCQSNLFWLAWLLSRRPQSSVLQHSGRASTTDVASVRKLMLLSYCSSQVHHLVRIILTRFATGKGQELHINLTVKHN